MPFGGCLLSSTFWGNWKFNYSLPLSGIPVQLRPHPRRMRLDHSIVWRLALGSIVLRNVHAVFPLNSSSATPATQKHCRAPAHPLWRRRVYLRVPLSPLRCSTAFCCLPPHRCAAGDASPRVVSKGGRTSFNISTSFPFPPSILQSVACSTASAGKPSSRLHGVIDRQSRLI